MAANPPLLEFRDFHFSYMAGTPMAVQAVRGVNLQIREGERVAIVGPPQSGKSTLVQAAVRLLPLERGQVWFRGKDVSGNDVRREELQRTIGMVFQRAESQVVEDVVGKDVAFGPTSMGLSAPDTRRRVEQNLNRVGLPYADFRLRYVHALSGGQLRRVAIAGVLAMETPVLMMDEPAAGLDPQGRRELVELLHHLIEERDLTLIIASTGLTDVALLCDRVVVLAEGKVVLDGGVREVLSALEDLPPLDISLPEPVVLARSLQSVVPGLRTDLLTLDELEDGVVRYLESVENSASPR